VTESIDQRHAERAARLAEESRAAGEAAVGSLVVRGGKVIAEAGESTRGENDPLGHAEAVAVRTACRSLGTRDLSDCTLYTTTEPCWMCSYAIRAARIGRVVIDRAIEAGGGATSGFRLLLEHDAPGLGPPPKVSWLNGSPDAEQDPARTLVQMAAVDVLDEIGRPREPSDLSSLPLALPDEGFGERAALDALRPALRGGRRLGDPGFLAHMDPPTPPVTWVARLWSAAMNQNLLHQDTAPLARELEERVVGWIAPRFGMSGGHFTPGSTIANLTALWAARQFGARRVISSEAAHLSVTKAAHLLGLPCTRVPVDHAGRIEPERLTAIAGDMRDAALVLTAGTTSTGAIDPLSLAVDAGARWVHIDAAWAGPLRLTDRYAHLLDGVAQADSVAISGHKWLFQPKESALVLFRDHAAANEAIGFDGAYLAEPNVGVLGSRGDGAALAMAATIMAWGRRGIAARIERCMAIADELETGVRRDDRLAIRHEQQSGVVLWRPRSRDAESVRNALRDAFVSLTRLEDGPWLRSVAANPNADPSGVVAAVLDAIERGT